MRPLFIFRATAILAVMTSCETGTDNPSGTQDAFAGRYSPEQRITMIRSDIHEEGVEASIDSITTYNRWIWDNEGTLTRVDLDINGQQLYNGPTYDTYHYDSHNRLEKLTHHIDGSDSAPNRTYLFHYTDGKLTSITFPSGEENIQRTTLFNYHPNADYPIEIKFVHPLQSWQQDIYNTDTLVQTWTLEWHDGNLVRATADPMARYCTGMSKIEYFYDSNPNPGKGFFSAEIISQDGFIDNPTLMCRNNLLHRVDYNPYHDEIHTYHNYWTYNYRPDGYPGQITTTYESLFWTTYTVKSFITYNMDNGKE